VPCGACKWCRSEDFRFCEATDIAGPGPRLWYGSTPLTTYPALWGGYSQYMYVHPNAVVHKVPSNIPAAHAAAFLPFSNGVEWAYGYGQVGLGDSILIQGPGQQGLACVIAAKAAGASCIIVSGLTRDARRMEVARMLGADYTIDVETEDLVSKVRDYTGGDGVNVVVEGRLECLRAVGHVVKLVRELEASLEEGIKVRRKDRPAKWPPSLPLLLRGEDGREVQVSRVHVGAGTAPYVTKILSAKLRVCQAVGSLPAHQRAIGSGRVVGLRPIRKPFPQIESAAAAETTEPSESMKKVAGAMATRKRLGDEDMPLTNRELQVLRHVALGLSNREIGRSLDISVETVKEHVQNILRKIDVTDRTQAAVWAVRRGLV
jgi:DNA-binding CsgD family transcriptional regulator